ncbi:MAG: sorbosone dehydrogenase family protein [Hydrogenophilaceae bacterium]|jgi:glucose/arabinose dehydrogenase|nr:sorbosone dehydrogenase family protein [Hydrogenophilaceae bacterium]
MRRLQFVRAACVLLLLAACGGPAPDRTGTVGYGAAPLLPEAHRGLLPTVNAARAVGWPAGAAPVAAEGFAVARYAEGLAHPRQIVTLPNGDVLVAEASTLPERGGGLLAWARNSVQRSAGALAENANRITLLRDADGDGDVDLRTVFAEGLNQPYGMAVVGAHFYVANTDAVLRFAYREGQTRVEGEGAVIVRIPQREGRNGHWTRDLIASPDGTKLYLSVGSLSNIPRNARELALEESRAAIWEIDLASGAHRIFASGLRNPNGLAWAPVTGALWTVVNERDELGDDLVPDYMTSVRDGGFYGWPWSYFGDNVDTRVRPPNPEMVARAIAPDYALGAHTASLGMHFYLGTLFPEPYRGGAFIGQHGSWNRSEPSGYKVIYVPFTDGRPSGPPQDFLTGFLDADERARGRPVGVAMDRTGALLVSDDVGNIVWRVAPD